MPKMRLGKIMPKVVLLSNTLLVGIKEWQLALLDRSLGRR